MSTALGQGPHPLHCSRHVALGQGPYPVKCPRPSDVGRTLSNVHGTSATPRCRLAQRGDGGLYSDCPGRLSCVEMRTCGCSLVSCPPPPPPPASGSVTLARRGQDPTSGLYAMRRSPIGPVAADQRSKPSVYWQVSGLGNPAPCPQPRRTDLAADRHVTSGENDDVTTGNRAESVGSVLDAVPKADKSPDLVLNGKHRDQKLTGTGSSALASRRDDRRCDSSTVPKRFNNQQTLDGN